MVQLLQDGQVDEEEGDRSHQQNLEGCHDVTQHFEEDVVDCVEQVACNGVEVGHIGVVTVQIHALLLNQFEYKIINMIKDDKNHPSIKNIKEPITPSQSACAS